MNSGCVTVITPICGGKEHVDALKRFLRTEVEPSFVPGESRKILKCQPRFPFDKIASLHFCSFAVLDGEGELGSPRLVFEATFDGSRDRFLDALVHAAPGAIDEIYRHCGGYPVSGSATPELVRKYLARHDQGANAFYLGSPGRTVAQIKDEAEAYDLLANSMSRPWSRHRAMPATYAGILQELRGVIRGAPGHHWAAQATAAVPWEVAWRKAVPVAAVLAVLGAACMLGSWIGDAGLGQEYLDLVRDLLLNSSQRWMSYLVPDSDVYLATSLPPLVLILISIALRWLELLPRLLFKDPIPQSIWLRVPLKISGILKYFVDGVFVLSALALIVTWNPSPRQSVMMLVGAGGLFLLFQHWVTLLRLAAQSKKRERARKLWRWGIVETLRVGMTVAATLTLLVFTRSVFLIGHWLEGTVLELLFDPNRKWLLDVIPTKLQLNGHLVIWLQLSVLIMIWIVLRLVELGLRIVFKDPRQQSFWMHGVFQILVILRHFVVAVVVWSALVLTVNWHPSLLDAVMILIAAGSLVLLFQLWLTSLKLAVQFKELKPVHEAWRCALVDAFGVGTVVAATCVVVVLTRFIFGSWLEGEFQELLFDPIGLTLPKLIIYAVVGAIAAYAIGYPLLAGLRMLLRANERIDALRFSGAGNLAAFDNSAVYEREEGGINTYQNHLISLTQVKPGRTLGLRLTLLAVGLLCRFWYNNGQLGGIATILSARWVLIDRGRRLLFLDHYGGAWNSYLNEFIDMTAVFGLNAIWTNTFITVGESRYGFPETEYYFWKGAQAESPFKAYVRHSQVETLAWYSAYPTLSTDNVNTNTWVRRSLFMPLSSCETDALVQEL